ncbi:MAG TPA: hypothetical protein VJ302_00360 [Blastocatellia bacterium]|nr:hypothetical protein [Blastocatellia bacterium]
MKRLLLIVSCLVLLAGLVSGLWATRAINQQPPSQVMEVAGAGVTSGLMMEKLAQQSDLIITGQCLQTSSAWVDRRLVTVATVSVNESIKGAPAQTVAVVMPGGIDANRRIPIAMTYPGAPTIKTKEEVFLFLKTSGEMSNSYEVTGFAQGKLSIMTDDQGQKMVARDQVQIQSKSGAGTVRGTLRMTPLSDFKQRVREYVK